MKISILGGGLAAISLAYFLQSEDWIDEIIIVEKESRLGGLAKTHRKGNILYDIGPHIIFSKDVEILDFMLNILGEDKNALRRSNKIIYKDRLVNYPFENDLSKLDQASLQYCINSFLLNPYINYNPHNMLQFFLTTFGEGITECYLRPYNEKIWKFDPSYMNTKMVDRIPKPTNEEIIRSAEGETVDGYLHQLYFYYPQNNGIEDLINKLESKLNREKIKIYLNQTVKQVDKNNEKYIINTNANTIISEMLISTIPVTELTSIYKSCSKEIFDKSKQLMYNSIVITMIHTKEDLCGDNFTFTIPDKEIIFHRISKMDFLGENYKNDGASYIVEITYRDGDKISLMSDSEILEEIYAGLKKINFIQSSDDIIDYDILREKYAYVIYDLHHEENMKIIRAFFKSEGIFLHGRFGDFEYWNMDAIIRNSMNMVSKINEKR